MTARTGSAGFDRARSGSFRRTARAAILLCLVMLAGTAGAFQDLTPAQGLVYDTAHLANTSAGQQIIYVYRGWIADGEVVEDRASLSITRSHPGDKRDVTLDFLSAERHLPLPDFTAFRGNPVIIAMLEHIAQSFGRETGGGVLYFRNRIRDALAGSAARIEKIEVAYGTGTINATKLSFMPFAGDPYLAEKPEYTGSVFSITLSEDVPGGVLGVAVRSGDGASIRFTREISIKE